MIAYTNSCFSNHDYYYQSVITFAKNIGWCITESHHIFIICIKIAKIIIRMIMFLATYIWFRDEYLLFVLLLYRLTWGWQWSNKKLEIRNLWSVKLIFISQFNNTVMFTISTMLSTVFSLFVCSHIFSCFRYYVRTCNENVVVEKAIICGFVLTSVW